MKAGAPAIKVFFIIIISCPSNIRIIKRYNFLNNYRPSLLISDLYSALID